MFEHVDLRFAPVIRNKLSCDTQPFRTGLIQGANFYFSIRMNLLGNVLRLPRLNVKFAIKNVGCTKGTHARLIPIDRSNKIDTAFLEKLFDFLHKDSLISSFNI